MLERQVIIPVSPDELWHALTDADSILAWFGARVDWDLRPGGQARFSDDDGTCRRGVVDIVVPGRQLSFRWWRDPDDPDHPDPAPSQVSYRLEPEVGATQLTVTEQRLPVEQRLPASPPSASASASASAGVTSVSAIGAGSWTAWDSRLFRCWARAAAPVLVGLAIG